MAHSKYFICLTDLEHWKLEIKLELNFDALSLELHILFPNLQDFFFLLRKLSKNNCYDTQPYQGLALTNKGAAMWIVYIITSWTLKPEIHPVFGCSVALFFLLLDKETSERLPKLHGLTQLTEGAIISSSHSNASLKWSYSTHLSWSNFYAEGLLTYLKI